MKETLQADSLDVSDQRKADHLSMALQSQIDNAKQDARFYYEPLHGIHPTGQEDLKRAFLGQKLKAPIWISSMTGGTKEAGHINRHLAMACAEFGLGMGLGSCRPILEGNQKFFNDYNLRPILGPDCPFYANLGIAQIEQLLKNKEIEKILAMIDRLQVNGLVVHINPIQEWLQPEGDRYSRPGIETIAELNEKIGVPLIVKEVGQGIGPKGLKALINLSVAAIEFGALGGTNFSQLELSRNQSQTARTTQACLAFVGHTKDQMIQFIKDCQSEKRPHFEMPHFIISGGVKTFLDGHYLINQLGYQSVYGLGSTLLPYARSAHYNELRQYFQQHIQGLRFAQQFLEIKK